MALTDPQVITVATVAQTLNKVATPTPTSTLYRKDDGSLELLVSHQVTAKRTRSVARANSAKISADPLTTVNLRATASLYFVVDRLNVGFTNTELKDTAAGLLTWLTANSNANLIKMLNQES